MWSGRGCVVAASALPGAVTLGGARRSQPVRLTVLSIKRNEMSPPSLFHDVETGSLDTDRVLAEAIPLAKLVGLIGVVGYAPLAFLAGEAPFGFDLLFVLASQFVLAVGAAVVLLYVVSRAIQLSRE